MFPATLTKKDISYFHFRSSGQSPFLLELEFLITFRDNEPGACTNYCKCIVKPHGKPTDLASDGPEPGSEDFTRISIFWIEQKQRMRTSRGGWNAQFNLLRSIRRSIGPKRIHIFSISRIQYTQRPYDSLTRTIREVPLKKSPGEVVAHQSRKRGLRKFRRSCRG